MEQNLQAIPVCSILRSRDWRWDVTPGRNHEYAADGQAIASRETTFNGYMEVG